MALVVDALIKEFKLEVHAGENGLNDPIKNSQLTRPGIELAGLFDFYEHDRIQIFGSKEVTFFGWLSESDQEIRVEMLFEKKPPAFIFSKHVDIPDVFIRMGNKYNIPVLKSYLRTSELFSKLYQYLFSKLAPRQSIHGTLVDINGVGVLIRGKSGVGKSEVALELVRRGHQLVADDRVDVYQREVGSLVGEAPEVLREHLEIRGIGIVNVVKLFGASAFKDTKDVMLIIDLEKWDDSLDYDRLGLDEATTRIFETDVVNVKVPITAARSVPSLIEVAAMNTRLKSLGTNMAKDFTDSISETIKRKQNSKK